MLQLLLFFSQQKWQLLYILLFSSPLSLSLSLSLLLRYDPLTININSLQISSLSSFCVRDTSICAESNNNNKVFLFLFLSPCDAFVYCIVEVYLPKKKKKLSCAHSKRIKGPWIFFITLIIIRFSFVQTVRGGGRVYCIFFLPPVDPARFDLSETISSGFQLSEGLMA